MRQFVYILSGFFIGQGGMLLAQSYLMILNEFSLVSVLGIGLGLLSLLQWVSDGGGVFLLSKAFSKTGKLHGFRSFVLARLVVGFLAYGVVYISLILLSVESRIFDVFKVGWMIVLIWSFNLTGVLDGAKRNEYSGPFSGACWFFSAIACVLFYDEKESHIIVSFMFVFGLFVSLVVQWVVAFKLGIVNDDVGYDFKIFKRDLKNILSYNSAYIMAQAYGRIVAILLDKYFGSSVSSIYIYAKSIANTVSQVVVFLRRVEFSNLHAYIELENFTLLGVLLRQKLSVVLSFSSVVVMILVVFIVIFGGFFQYYDVVIVVLNMLCLSFFWVMVSSYGQVLLAMGCAKEYALIIVVGGGVGLLSVSFFLKDYGMIAVYMSELMSFMVQILMYIAIIKSLKLHRNKICD